MKIAVLGTGDVGGTLGKGWAAKGHQVVFGSRHPDSDEVRELLAAAGPNASAVGNAEAVASADVAVLAVPWDAARQVVESIRDWKGKILVDCTNPDRLEPAVGGGCDNLGGRADRRLGEGRPRGQGVQHDGLEQHGRSHLPQRANHDVHRGRRRRGESGRNRPGGRPGLRAGRFRRSYG